MPIYEYECPACGVFEVHQSIKAEDLKECPNVVFATSEEPIHEKTKYCYEKIKKLMSLGHFYFNHHLKH